jgi:DNA primase
MLGAVADQIALENLKRVKIKDDFIASACPFHKGGEERRASFWINRETGAWGCFACTKHGSSLKWLLKDMGLKSLKIQAVIEEAEVEAKKTEKVRQAKARLKSRKDFKGDHILPDSLLGVFDWMPLSLVEQGYSPELLKEHDIGYDKRNDRITYPIRDLYGNLVGISGRSTRPGEEPKYLVYNGRRTLDGKEVLGELGEWFPEYSNDGIRDHLWRMDKFYKRLFETNSGQLVIVEGYKAALWMVQHGWTNTCALMGSRMSATQERIVRSLGAETFVLLDNNYAGKEGAKDICQRLAVSSFPVYRCRYLEHHSENTQPDDLTEAELEAVLCSATRAGGRFYDRQIRRLGRQHRAGPPGRQKVQR